MLGELFETLISFLPIALIIAIRIAASRKKAAAGTEDGNGAIKALASKLRRGGRAVPEDPDEDEDEFVPYALSNGVETYHQGISSPPIPVPKPVRREQLVAPEAPVEFPGIGLPEPEKKASRIAPGSVPVSPPKKAALPESLGRLPPLKQAVVMAEILGPPKGLSHAPD